MARTTRRAKQEEGIWVNELDFENVRRPKVIDEGMKYFGAVDLNDRYRQGYLNMESSWATKRLWVRIFTTILGICFTDAYLAYNLETQRANFSGNKDFDKLHYKGFLGKLAHQLILNKLDEEHIIAAATRSHSSHLSVRLSRTVPTLIALNTVESI